jgi:hypothetical protein
LPATFLAATSGSMLPLYATSLAYGVSISFFWPPLLRELSILSPGALLWKVLGAFNMIWAFGSALGSYLGPTLYERFELPISVAIVAALVSLAMASTAMRVPVVPEPRCAEGARTSEESRAPVGEPRPSPRSVLFLHLSRVANFTASFAKGGVSYVFIYVGSARGFGLETIGWILFALDLGRFAAFGALRAFSSWHFSLTWLFAAQLVAGCTLILSGWASEVWQFAVLFPFLGLLTGLTYYSSLYYGLNLRSEEGRRSGIHEAILASGFCLGTFVSGGAGALAPSWPGAVLVAPGAVLLLGILFQIPLAIAARREGRLPPTGR